MYWIRKFFSKPKVHKAALVEVLLCAAFSILPFLTAYLVQMARNPMENAPALGAFLEKGQFFLLAYGVFGTLIWLAFVRGDRPRHDARVFLGLLSLFVVFPLLSFMGVDYTFESIRNERIIDSGYLIYLLVLTLNYLLLFYINIDPPEAGSSLREGADRMKEKYSEFVK